MTVQRVHIRGNTGTQILQAFAALSTILPKDEPIICVDAGGLPYDGTNKLNEYFNPQIRIIDVDTGFKTPYWIPGVATRIFENRDKILKWLIPIWEYEASTHNAVHIRVGDKQICSDENHKKLLQMGHDGDDRLLVYTNDSDYAKKNLGIDGHIISDMKAEEDWFDIMNARITWAAPSSFIMSMMLINPEKRIIFLGEKYHDGGYDTTGDMIFLREAMQFCPNVSIIND